MGTQLHYSGLIVAGIGFFLTRFTVNLAIYEDTVRFFLAGVLPLALGLGLAAFGIALVVADVEATVVRTTALWCVIGTGTMLVLVALTLLGSTGNGQPGFSTALSQTYLSNFLIGGSIGGTLTGLYASSNYRQRQELQQQANRLEVLNRMLRHEVLNAMTAIQGYASLGLDKNPDAERIIQKRSHAVVDTIEEVKYLARGPGTSERIGATIELDSVLAASVQRIRKEYPAVDLSINGPQTGLPVHANEQLELVFTQLLENAAVHTTTDQPSVDISVRPTAHTVRISVSDNGPGLPESQQALLETGDIEEFDNPAMGFGLNVVRLLVEDYGGAIETEVGTTGTTVTVILHRARADGTRGRLSQPELRGVRPAIPHLMVTLGAAIVAGIVYGLVAEQLGGSVGFIGVYYGVRNTIVGWITHEFHSIVFAFVFAGLLSTAPERYHHRISVYVAIGVGWSLVLWIVAAGIISPIWLQLLGIPASIPSLSLMLLAPHLSWGISLGVLTALGYRYVTPRLSAVASG